MTGYQSKKKAAQAKLDSMEREALKLALEFVESINLGSRSASVEQQRKAITAIKEALAQTAQEKKHDRRT